MVLATIRVTRPADSPGTAGPRWGTAMSGWFTSRSPGAGGRVGGTGARSTASADRVVGRDARHPHPADRLGGHRPGGVADDRRQVDLLEHLVDDGDEVDPVDDGVEVRPARYGVHVERGRDGVEVDAGDDASMSTRLTAASRSARSITAHPRRAWPRWRRGRSGRRLASRSTRRTAASVDGRDHLVDSAMVDVLLDERVRSIRGVDDRATGPRRRATSSTAASSAQLGLGGPGLSSDRRPGRGVPRGFWGRISAAAARRGLSARSRQAAHGAPSPGGSCVPPRSAAPTVSPARPTATSDDRFGLRGDADSGHAQPPSHSVRPAPWPRCTRLLRRPLPAPYSPASGGTTRSRTAPRLAGCDRDLGDDAGQEPGAPGPPRTTTVKTAPDGARWRL